MICPNCGYEYGWSGELPKFVDGDHGSFFILSATEAIRPNDGRCLGMETRIVAACPKCGIVFIDR